MAEVSSIFVNLSIIFIIAAAAGYIFNLLKQPIILAYVLAGIIATPMLGLITDSDLIGNLSLIGITFLLFIVGLEIDFKRLNHVATVTTYGGLIQIISMFILAFGLGLLLGFSKMVSLYFGLIASFSSTMVVMKLLSDAHEINTLHGRIILGILLLEDLLAVIALSLLGSNTNFAWATVGIAVGKILLLGLFVYGFAKLILPRYVGYAAKHQELLFVSSLGICFLFSLLFEVLGLSVVIGAFIAGLLLGNTEYSDEIISKIKYIRDFFSLLFFVSLGMNLKLDIVSTYWFTILSFIGLIIIIKPLIIVMICSLFNYTKKPSFATAVYMSQIGEFGLIIVSQGLLYNHLTQDIFSVIVLVTLVTMTTTTYALKNMDRWYKRFDKWTPVLDKLTTTGLEYVTDETKPSIVLAGYNRKGYDVLRTLKKKKKQVIVVDYNPEVIHHLAENKYHCLYGDMNDDEILHKLNLSTIKMLICTIPHEKIAIKLVRHAKKENKKMKLIMTASTIKVALKLYNEGADYVVLPDHVGGEYMADIVTRMRGRRIKMKEARADHINHLHTRKKLGV